MEKVEWKSFIYTEKHDNLCRETIGSHDGLFCEALAEVMDAYLL